MNFKRITMAKDLILLVVTKLIRLQLRQLPVTFWSNCQPVGFFLNADVFPAVTGSAEPVTAGNTSAFAGY